MNPALAQHFSGVIDASLKFVELASHTVKRAGDEITVHRQQQKRAADLAAPVLNLLVSTGAVRAEQRDAAAAMLGSHAETLSLLKTAVERLAEARQKKAGDLGDGVDDAQPTTAYDSLADSYAGRKTSQKKASDLAILAVLNEPG